MRSTGSRRLRNSPNHVAGRWLLGGRARRGAGRSARCAGASRRAGGGRGDGSPLVALNRRRRRIPGQLAQRFGALPAKHGSLREGRLVLGQIARGRPQTPRRGALPQVDIRPAEERSGSPPRRDRIRERLRGSGRGEGDAGHDARGRRRVAYGELRHRKAFERVSAAETIRLLQHSPLSSIAPVEVR